jgi:hypothetical protein
MNPLLVGHFTFGQQEKKQVKKDPSDAFFLLQQLNIGLKLFFLSK